MNYDIAVIGAGITGAGIAYELSKYNLSVALIDKYNAPSQGATKANSGILHAGYDDREDQLRGKLVVRGNKLYDRWHEEIGFRMKREGSLVVAFNEEQVKTIKEEKARGDKRGIPGLVIWGQDELRKNEPNLSKDAVAALFAPTAGVVCPMEVSNFLFRNAVMNGVTPFLDQEVTDFEKTGSEITTIVTTKEKISAKLIVNAAGVFGDVISRKAGIDTYHITPRKGEYILLEPNKLYNVNRVIFPTPTKTSKGVLVSKTITGDILLGPTAVNMADTERDNIFTTPEGLQEIIEKTKILVPTLRTDLTVKTFAGVRAQPDTNDFIIEDYSDPSNFINAIGIRSPGLTSAPAVAEYVLAIIEKKTGTLVKKEQYNTTKRVQFHSLELAKDDPAWGKTLTPQLDSPPLPLLDAAWNFGVQDQLYNYTCFTDLGLGMDLSSTFQNALIQWVKEKGVNTNDILYRHSGSWQIKDSPK